MPRPSRKPIFKRPRSEYWHVRFTNAHGVEIRRSARTQDYAEACAFLEGLKNGSGITFAEVVEEFFAHHPLRPTTRTMYQSSLRQWHPIVGNLLMDHITARHVRRYLAGRLRQVQPQSARIGVRFLSSLFEFARTRWQVALRNPVKEMGPLGLGRSPERVRWLTDEEVARVLAATRSPLHWLLTLTAIETGMRKREIFNLRVSDVDLAQRRILVRHGASKSGKARIVPVSETLFRALSAHLAHPHPSGFVFIEPRTGRPPVAALWWVNVAARAGLKDVHFHDLRHHFASRYVQRGGRLHVLAMILGHADIKMTMRYAHLATSDMEHEFRALDGK